MSHQHNAHRWQFTEGRVAKRASEHAAAKRIVAGSTFAVLAGLTLALGIAPAQAQADTADNDVQLTTPGKLPSATASFDQSAGYFIWPYQFGYQNVSKANPKGTVHEDGVDPAKQKPATAPAAGEYGWAAPGYRDYDACMASLDAQIKQVKESGFQYVTVSYLISPLNAKQKADGSWGDPNKQGDMEPDTTLNDAIINRVLDAGLKPVIYFSQGNPDKRLGDNPVAAFTMDQIRATIEHAIKTFAGRGIIWESWNEPDSAGWTSGMTAENKPHWIALDQFIGDCVDKYDKGADYVYGNFATPSNNNQVADDVLAKAHATARSGHGYGGGTPESGTKPSLKTELSAYMDSEFGVPSSGRIRWAANSWGDWGDKDDAHPEEGYLATEQDAETQAAWLGRQLLMKDISGTNLSTIYRLVGYDSFSVNDNADGANPGVIKTTPAYEQVKYLGNQLKGYTFEKLLPVDGKEYDGKVDGVETDYTTDADTKRPNEFRVYAAVYKNAAGNEKLVYWHGGRTGVNASTSPYVTDKSVTKDFTVKFGGKDLKLTSTSWAHVYGTAKATDTTLSTAVGTAPMLPDTVELTWPDGIKTNETVAWDKVDASAYAKKGTFTVKGTVSGVSVTATVNVVTQTSLTNTSIWKDEDGNAIQAHGGSIVQAKDGAFYWVGQGAPDNVPTGEKGVFANQWLYTTINMYKSKDLTNWEAVKPVASIDDADAKLYARGNVEGSTSTVLKYTNADGTAAKGFEQLLKEHPQYATDAALGCKIERPHIIYNAKTDRYVVWAHWEGTVGYGSSQLIVFQSEGSDPAGPYHPVSWGKDAQGNEIYHAQPTVTIDGKQTAVPSRDLTAWADPDTGEAYVISVFAGKGLRLYKLDDTYTKILTEGSYSFMTDANIEAPSLFKENGRYYMLTSRQDYWDPTQTEYASTTNLADPKAWSGLTEIQSRDEARKNWGGDASTRTYLGQPTYVLQYKDAKGKPAVMLMADDWNPKKAATANVDTTIANYVFNPVKRTAGWKLDVKYNRTISPMDFGSDAAVPASAEAAAATTAPGVAPVLPTTVTVNWTDGGETAERVTWDKVDASAYATAGKSFTVKGTVNVAGAVTDAQKTLSVAATVKVKAARDLFTDIQGADTWVINEGWLDYAVEHGLMTGYKDEATQQLNGKFGPHDQITRGQVAVVLFRIANPTDDSTTNPEHYGATTGFSDQGAFPYYKSAILWLKQHGVLTGDKDPVTQASLNTVRPDAPITRQELATMVARFASNVMGVDTSKADPSVYAKMKDARDVMPFAQKSMAWAYSAQVLTGGKGADDGKLMPLDQAQRSQAAKIFSVLHRDVLKLK